MTKQLTVRKTKRTNKAIGDALRATGGFYAPAAAKLGICHSAVSRRVAASPELQAIMAEVCEAKLDLAETVLMASIRQGEAWAVCFYLKCKGKARGYVERQEITGANGGPISTLAQTATDEELERIIDIDAD